jgi:hypothetical protein
MRLARECRCERSLVLEAGVCFRCGRLLEPALPDGAVAQLDTALLNLELAVIGAQHELREQAAEVGVISEVPDSLDEPVPAADRRAYALWLETYAIA